MCIRSSAEVQHNLVRVWKGARREFSRNWCERGSASWWGRVKTDAALRTWSSPHGIIMDEQTSEDHHITSMTVYRISRWPTVLAQRSAATVAGVQGEMSGNRSNSHKYVFKTWWAVSWSPRWLVTWPWKCQNVRSQLPLLMWDRRWVTHRLVNMFQACLSVFLPLLLFSF